LLSLERESGEKLGRKKNDNLVSNWKVFKSIRVKPIKGIRVELLEEQRETIVDQEETLALLIWSKEY